MPLLKTYKLFICHAYAQHDDYDRLIELLDDMRSLSYSLFSVPSDPRYRRMTKSNLQEELRKQIKPVNCVLALDTVYKEGGDWVQFELDQAVFARKPIIGVRQLRNKDISSAISDVAQEIVGWNPDALLAAIKENSVYSATNL